MKDGDTLISMRNYRDDRNVIKREIHNSYFQKYLDDRRILLQILKSLVNIKINIEIKINIKIPKGSFNLN